MSNARRPPPSAEAPAKKTRAEAAALVADAPVRRRTADAEDFEGFEDVREEAAVAAIAFLLETVHDDIGAGPPPPMVPMVFHAAFLPPPPNLSHASVDDAMRYAKCSVDRYRVPALEQLNAMADIGNVTYNERNADIKRMVALEVVPVITLYLSQDYDHNSVLQCSALKLLVGIAGNAAAAFRVPVGEELCDVLLLNGVLRVATQTGAAKNAVLALTALQHMVDAVLLHDLPCKGQLRQWACADDGIVPALTQCAVDPETPMEVAMVTTKTLTDMSNFGWDIDAAAPVLPLLKQALQHHEHVVEAMFAIHFISCLEGGALGRSGAGLVVAHGIDGDITRIMVENPPSTVKALAFAVFTRICGASDAHKWHVAHNSVLNALTAALVPNSAVSERTTSVSGVENSFVIEKATVFLKALMADDDREMLRRILNEVPHIVPALLRGIDDSDGRTRDQLLQCLAAMVRAAGPAEHAQLAAAGALESLASAMP